MTKSDIIGQQDVLSTLLIHNRVRIEQFIGQETLVVCGSARGMTSLIAYSLYNMNYFIGSRIGSMNYEDRDMMQAMPNVRNERNAWRLAQHQPFLNLVEARNSEHIRWGFKLPYATTYVGQLSKLLRNPIFVVCLRNPAAVARSSFQKHPEKDFTLATLMDKGGRPLRAIEKLLQTDRHGLIVIDMDEVRRKPGAFLSEFAGLLRLQGDLGQIEQDITSSNYKPSDARPGTIFIPQGRTP